MLAFDQFDGFNNPAQRLKVTTTLFLNFLAAFPHSPFSVQISRIWRNNPHQISICLRKFVAGFGYP